MSGDRYDASSEYNITRQIFFFGINNFSQHIMLFCQRSDTHPHVSMLMSLSLIK